MPPTPSTLPRYKEKWQKSSRWWTDHELEMASVLGANDVGTEEWLLHCVRALDRAHNETSLYMNPAGEARKYSRQERYDKAVEWLGGGEHSRPFICCNHSAAIPFLSWSCVLALILMLSMSS